MRESAFHQYVTFALNIKWTVSISSKPNLVKWSTSGLFCVPHLQHWHQLTQDLVPVVLDPQQNRILIKTWYFLIIDLLVHKLSVFLPLPVPWWLVYPASDLCLICPAHWFLLSSSIRVLWQRHSQRLQHWDHNLWHFWSGVRLGSSGGPWGSPRRIGSELWWFWRPLLGAWHRLWIICRCLFMPRWSHRSGKKWECFHTHKGHISLRWDGELQSFKLQHRISNAWNTFQIEKAFEVYTRNNLTELEWYPLMHYEDCVYDISPSCSDDFENYQK